MHNNGKDPLVALNLSVLFTGLGQIYAGRYIRGIVFMVAEILFLVYAISYIINPVTRFSKGIVILILPYLLIMLFIHIDALLCVKKYNITRNLASKASAGKKTILVMLLILQIIGIQAIAIGIAAYVRNFIAEPFKVPSTTMQPAILKGDRIFVDKKIYRSENPRRWDIIVFKWPEAGKANLKRIIGLPNESFEIKGGEVLINGAVIKKPDHLKGIRYSNMGDYGGEGKTVNIPADCYYVIGDNSGSSVDSRIKGFVGKKDIIGKVYKIFYPFERAGKVD